MNYNSQLPLRGIPGFHDCIRHELMLRHTVFHVLFLRLREYCLHSGTVALLTFAVFFSNNDTWRTSLSRTKAKPAIFSIPAPSFSWKCGRIIQEGFDRYGHGQVIFFRKIDKERIYSQIVESCYSAKYLRRTQGRLRLRLES
jgi:hypothetical protein